MKSHVVGIVLMGLLLSACATASATERDQDAIALADLNGQAWERAAQVVKGPILRQVDVLPETGSTLFFFVDPAATLEVAVDIPASKTSPDQWQVRSTSVSKLTGYTMPGMNMGALQVGPTAVVNAMTSHWKGCKVNTVILFGQGDNLQWTSFCKLADGGVVSAMMDNRTREFRPSPAPPAYPPPTALP